MKRPSDQEFHEEIDTLDKQQRYALAMLKATREADRARAEEARLTEEMVRKDEQIQALAGALEKYSVRILVIGEGNRLPDEVTRLLKELGRLP